MNRKKKRKSFFSKKEKEKRKHFLWKKNKKEMLIYIYVYFIYTIYKMILFFQLDFYMVQKYPY